MPPHFDPDAGTRLADPHGLVGLLRFSSCAKMAAVAKVVRLHDINRLIDEELAKAKATFGQLHFDIIVLEAAGATQSTTAIFWMPCVT
jgi:hypothetical protein